jgi:hypothetical protein
LSARACPAGTLSWLPVLQGIALETTFRADYTVSPMSTEHKPDGVRIYLLPNLMTACNLACGFFAVLMIFKGLIEVQVEMSDHGPLSAKQYYEISRDY